MRSIVVVLFFCMWLADVSGGMPELLLPDAKITVRVVDISGHPISGADVGVGFSQGGNAWVGEHKAENIRGLSDTNGLFSAQAKCSGSIGVGVEKDGFYQTIARHSYPGTYQNKMRWEPWDPVVEVVLKEKKNPISLYVKEAKLKFPDNDESIGFDLISGDWVNPYGRGNNSDFLFTFSKTFHSDQNYAARLIMHFPNPEDGIQEIYALPTSSMSLRLSHKAPMSGYSTNKVWDMGCVAETGSYGFEDPDGGINYFFRVRTSTGDDGCLEEAYYGKIYGPIRVVGIGRDTTQVIFKYYFNPTPNDRNLEFDPSKNLFGGTEHFAP